MITAAKAMQTAMETLEKTNQTTHQCLMEWADGESSAHKLNGEVYGVPNASLLQNSSKCTGSVAAFSNMMVNQV